MIYIIHIYYFIYIYIYLIYIYIWYIYIWYIYIYIWYIYIYIIWIYDDIMWIYYDDIWMIDVDIVSFELTDVENHSEPCPKKHTIYLIYLKSGLKCPNHFKSGSHQSQNLRPPRPTAPFFVLRVSSAWPRSLVLRGHGQVSPWPWMLPWKLPLPWLWSQPLPWLLMEKWWKIGRLNRGWSFWRWPVNSWRERQHVFREREKDKPRTKHKKNIEKLCLTNTTEQPIDISWSNLNKPPPGKAGNSSTGCGLLALAQAPLGPSRCQ